MIIVSKYAHLVIIRIFKKINVVNVLITVWNVLTNLLVKNALILMNILIKNVVKSIKFIYKY